MDNPTTSDNGDDERYFILGKPLVIADRKLDRLLIDPRGTLAGKDFFSLIAEFRRQFPDLYRTTFNLYSEINFVSLVVAKLNKITPEDLYKLDYGDLPPLFLRAAAFHYSGGATKPTTTETLEKP